MKIFYLIFLFFINLAQAEQQALPQARLALGFYYPSLSNISTRTDIQVSLDYWMKELASKINLDNYYAVLFDDISNMNTAFHNGQLDMVIAPPLLLAIHFDKHLLSDGFAGVKDSKKMDQLALIVRKDLSSTNPEFFDKRLLLPKKDFLAEIFLDNEVLDQYRVPFQKVFSDINRVNKNKRIILDLFFDKADVAVVYKSAIDIMTELNPQVSERIKIIKTFPVKSTHFGYFHRNYKYKDKLKNAALQFSSEPRGAQILELFNATEVAICHIDELEQFNTFYESYKKKKAANLLN